MVPGMLERERLVADMRRAEWLADAVHGPASRRAPMGKTGGGEHHELLTTRARRLLAAIALAVGNGVRRLRSAPRQTLPAPNVAQPR